MFEEVSDILVVDDEPWNLELISAIFADDSDINISTAEGGLQALDFLKYKLPDLIVLDILMPQMSGIEVLKYLKSNPTTASIPVIVISGDEGERKRALSLGVSDFIAKPFDIEEVKLRILNNLKIKKYNDIIKDMNELLQKELMKKTKDLREALQLAQEAEYEIVLKLGMISEFRDEETGTHIKRISYFAKLFAQLIDLSEKEQNLLLYSAPLHDVGKMAIPDSILKKPGPLIPEEFEIIKLHTTIGARILSSDKKFSTLLAGKIIAEQHHEKWDGSGYPYGLKGGEIHLYARIVAVCDVFDALTSHRVYRPAFTVEEALDIMKKGRGSHFDPEIFDVFINNLSQFIEIKEKFRD